MRAIILAAGFGTRLYPLTKDRPKPLLELAGRPIIDHVLDRVLESESLEDPALVVTNARFREDFRAWREGLPDPRREGVRIVANDVSTAADRRGAMVDLRWALDRLGAGIGARGIPARGAGAERAGAMETAGDAAVQAGRDIASAESHGYVVIAADNVFGFSLDEMIAVLDERPTAGAVAAVEAPEPLERLEGKGVACVDEEGWIVRVQEKPSRPVCPRRIAALYAFRPGLPAWIDRFLERDGNPDSPGHFLAWLVDTEASGVRVAAFPISGYRFDVGTPERLREAREFFEDGAAE